MEYTLERGVPCPQPGDPLLASGVTVLTPLRVAERLMREDGYSTVGRVLAVSVNQTGQEFDFRGKSAFLPSRDIDVILEAVIDPDVEIPRGTSTGEFYMHNVLPATFLPNRSKVFLRSCEAIDPFEGIG